MASVQLVDQLPWIEPDARIWAGIRSQLGPASVASPAAAPQAGRAPLAVLRSWIVRPWVPVSALAGILGLVLLLNHLDPPNPIQHEFTHFIQERERIYDNQRKLLLTHGEWQLREERNPFSQPASFSNKNPFQE